MDAVGCSERMGAHCAVSNRAEARLHRAIKEVRGQIPPATRYLRHAQGMTHVANRRRQIVEIAYTTGGARAAKARGMRSARDDWTSAGRRSASGCESSKTAAWADCEAVDTKRQIGQFSAKQSGDSQERLHAATPSSS